MVSNTLDRHPAKGGFRESERLVVFFLIGTKGGGEARVEGLSGLFMLHVSVNLDLDHTPFVP